MWKSGGGINAQASDKIEWLKHSNALTVDKASTTALHGSADGPAVRVDMTLLGSTIAGRFRLDAPLGAGGMGSVYRAHDNDQNRSVALKLMLADGSGQRMLREANVLTELRHEAIVGYVAHGVTETGNVYLAMDLLEGVDLAQRLESGAIGVDQTVVLGRRIASGLAAAHALGIIHRDLKPANIFLPSNDPARGMILDFGIARKLSRSRVTQTGLLMGTPGYMAPEQCRGDRETGRQADVFALGCVLFECITGRPAFVGSNIMALLTKILFEEPPKLLEFCASAPQWIDALIGSMLAKEPEHRPADCTRVLLALESRDAGANSSTTAGELKRPAITEHERRMVAVVMLRESSTSPLAATIQAADSGSVPEPAQTTDLKGSFDELCDTVTTQGLRAEHLIDGSLSILVSLPIGPAEQAARAAHCALSLQALRPSASISLAMGRAELGGQYPVGEAIDRAAAFHTGTRLERIVIDEISADLLAGRFAIERDEHRTLLVGQRSAVDESRLLLGVATPCVGRERELGLLTGLTEECWGDRVARVVLVSAPAGVGKSRLRHELLRRLAARLEPPLRVWSATGEALSAGSAFAMLTQLVDSASRQVGTMPEAAEDLEAAQRLLRDRSQHGPGNLAALSEQVRTAFIALARSAAQKALLVIVLENLDWGDLPTVRVIDALLRSLDDHPVLVLALARPEVQEVFPKLFQDRNVLEIRLPGLARRAAEALVGCVLGERADRETLADIVGRAAGNALFLEELIRASAMGKHGDAPATVLGTLEARIQLLDPAERKILRAASVFGETFSAEGVRALLDMDQSVDRALDQLVEKEWILPSRQPPPTALPFPERGCEFTFRHALVRDAAYAMLPERDCVAAHFRAAQWLCFDGLEGRAREDSPAVDAVLVAQHYSRGHDAERAIPWWLRAARMALRGGDVDNAVKYSDEGLAHAKGQARAPFEHIRGESLIWRGDHNRGRTASWQALDFSVPQSADWYAAAGSVLVIGADVGDFSACEHLARSFLSPLPHTDLAARALGLAVRAMIWQGRVEMAAQLRSLQQAYAVKNPSSPWSGWCDMMTSVWHILIDEAPERSIFAGQRAVQYFERERDMSPLLVSQLMLARAYQSIGLFDESRREREACVEVAERMGAAYFIQLGKYLSAFIEMFAGNPESGYKLLLDARDGFEAAGNVMHEVQARAAIGFWLLANGDAGSAIREAEVALSKVNDCWPLFADVLAVLAQAHTAIGSLDKALDTSRRAMETADAIGGFNYIRAHCLVARIEALRKASTSNQSALDDARQLTQSLVDFTLDRAKGIQRREWRHGFLTRVRRTKKTFALAEIVLGQSAASLCASAMEPSL